MESESTGPAAHSAAAANGEVQRLSRLVDGLLTLGRAEADRPERAPVDINRTVADRVDAWSPLADERHVHLSATAAPLRDPSVPLIPGDLEQILDNLLANALDATPPGRSITVETADHGSTVTVTVVDEGPGISAEVRDRAFDRFWQGPGARHGTSGLGLAIVRQLARRNGASVDLMPALAPSTAPDDPSSGARAVVRLVR
jgi:signal transduction histidine kinase